MTTRKNEGLPWERCKEEGAFRKGKWGICCFTVIEETTLLLRYYSRACSIHVGLEHVRYIVGGQIHNTRYVKKKKKTCTKIRGSIVGSDYYAPNVPLLIVYFLQQISKVGYGAQIISFERKGAQCYS